MVGGGSEMVRAGIMGGREGRGGRRGGGKERSGICLA